MSRVKSRKVKVDIDYRVFHETGRKVLKVPSSLVMNTSRERLVIREMTCVEDIEEFFATNDLEELDNVEDLEEYLATLAEISKEFRYVHAELKFILEDEYGAGYAVSKLHLEKIRKFIKEGKCKKKKLKKNEGRAIDDNKLALEKKKLLSEEDYLLDRLTRNLKGIDPVAMVAVNEADHAIFKLETLFEDYLKLQCNLKVVCGDGYEDEFAERVRTNTGFVNGKILECNNRMKEILDARKEAEAKIVADEEERVWIEREEMNKKVVEEQKEELLLAKHTSMEIELRCTQLLNKFKTKPTTLGDHQLLEVSKKLGDLDTEFGDILSKITSFAKYASSVEIKDIFKSLETRRQIVSDMKTAYIDEVHAEVLLRDVSDEKLKCASTLKFELPKFQGYESEMDIYTFKSKFVKLVQPNVQKTFWADTLKLNYLRDPVLSLLQKIEDIEKIWIKLLDSYGNVRLLLKNKLSGLENFGGLYKVRGDAKVISVISGVINSMIELSELAESHNLENELYYGGGVEKVLDLLGDVREKKILKENLNSDLGRKEEWEKLVKFLREELKLREKYLLHEKSKTCFGIEPKIPLKRKEHLSDLANSYNNDVFPEQGKPLCHLCGKNDHMSYVSPYSQRRCVSYLACKTFVEKSPLERLKLLEGKGLCYQCLTPGAKIDHAKNCNEIYCCKDQSHFKHDKKYHILVCDRHKHKTENSILLEKFKTKVIAKFINDLPPFSKNIKISFHCDANIASIHTGLESDSGFDTTGKGIFMFQRISLGNETFNVFYDSGCGDLCVKKSAIDKLVAMGRACQLFPGPIILSGVGDNKTICDHGVYKISLPLPNGENAVMSGICLDTVTSSFPSYPLGVAEEEIREDCLKRNGRGFNRKIPKCPQIVGGETDIMIGITYNKYFPMEIHRMPTGLAIYESRFPGADGAKGIIAGPHPSFSLGNSLFNIFGQNYYSHETIVYNRQFRLGLNVPMLGTRKVCESVDSDLDFEPSLDTLTSPIRSECHAARTPPVCKTFEMVEKAGTEISYRCMDCRNCKECKKSDRIESISIEEEVEQAVIERSVEVDVSKGRTVAKVPFMKNPVLRLRPNQGLAIKVYQAQIRNLVKNPMDME